MEPTGAAPERPEGAGGPSAQQRPPMSTSRRNNVIIVSAFVVAVTVVAVVLGTGGRSSTGPDVPTAATPVGGTLATIGTTAPEATPGTTADPWPRPLETAPPTTTDATTAPGPTAGTAPTSTLPPPPSFGSGIGPVFAGGAVLLPRAGVYVAVDAAAPERTLWTSDPCAGAAWPEVWPSTHDGIVVAYCGPSQIGGLDTATGRFLWTHPVQPHDIQFFRVSGGGVAIEYETRLEVLDLHTGAVHFTRDDLTPNLTDPIAADDTTVYLGLADTAVHALDITTGAERWSLPTTVNWITAAPEGVFIITHTGHRIIRVDAASGARRWTTEPTNGLLTGGAGIGVTSGRFIAQGGHSENLVAFDIANGKIAWTDDRGRGQRLVAVVGDGRVAFVREDNQLEVKNAATGADVSKRTESASAMSRPAIDDHRLAFVTVRDELQVRPLR